jgi:hypothetical protein
MCGSTTCKARPQRQPSEQHRVRRTKKLREAVECHHGGLLPFSEAKKDGNARLADGSPWGAGGAFEAGSGGETMVSAPFVTAEDWLAAGPTEGTRKEAVAPCCEMDNEGSGLGTRSGRSAGKEPS